MRGPVPIKSFGKRGLVREWPDGTREFVKWVDRRKHFMRKMQAWAIGVDIVDELEELKVERIILYIYDERPIFCTLDVFKAYALIAQFLKYEEQAFLYEGYWSPYEEK